MHDVCSSLGDLGRSFLYLWLGEALAMLGTSLTDFALRAWAFQHSGSVLDFSGTVLASALPMLIILPVAGSIADYFDRRYIIIASDAAVVTAMLFLALLLWNAELDTFRLFLFNSVVAAAAAFRIPAYRASVSGLLPKEKLVRANGMKEVSASMISMLAPMVAGAIMGFVGLSGVVTLTLIVSCFGFLAVLSAFAPFQRPLVSNQKRGRSLIGDLASNFSNAILFFRMEPLMLGLLFYEVIQGALIAFASTMLMPLVLSRYSTQELGLILTFGSLGAVTGAATLAIVGKSENLMRTILFCDVILATCVLISGVCSSVPTYCAVVFIALLSGAAAEGCSHALWMRKAPQQRQGSIFALVTVVMLVVSVTVVFSGGMIADNLFEPALVEGGIWSQSLAAWFGSGKGRGLALLFVVSGALGVIVSLIAFAHSHLRELDLIVPDNTAFTKG